MGRRAVQSLSLTRLCGIAILLLATGAVLSVLALNSVRSSSSAAVGEWRRFADQASAEQRVLRGYITQMGLGGLTDDYARLAATGDPSVAPLIYARGGAALAAMSAWPAANATPEEIKAQADLQDVVKAYIQRVPRLIQLHNAGAAPEAIRAAAIVPGAQRTREALAVLSAHVARTTTGDPKAIILLDVRRDLGLAGVSQHANAFALTRGPSDRAAAEEALAAARASLARYQARQDVTPEESAAVIALAAAIDAVDAGLDAEGQPGAHVDLAALQGSLLRVEALVYAEAAAAQNNLQHTLGQVARQAWLIILIVGAGAIAMTAGSIWLLGYRIAHRVKAITKTMRALAAGQLDVEIPATGDRDEIGEMSRALLVFRDGLKANEMLAQELAESSRLASLGAMVAGIAHELNTPLGNALTVSSTLEEQCRELRADLSAERVSRSALTAHGERLEEACGLIQRNLHRASQQIIAFKQMAVDQTSGARRPFNLDDVLRNTAHTLSPMFKRTPFRLELGEPSGVTMESLPGALSQVVTNLVENALKHGLEGRAQGVVRIRACRLAEGTIEIAVSDDGAGIPADVLPRIFRAFFTTRASAGGSGLGLHIVKTIVCGPLGGDIRVESAEGGGSRFILMLPEKAPAEAAAQSPSPEPSERVYYAVPQAAA